MERLTEKGGLLKACSICQNPCSSEANDCGGINDVLDRLADYEDSLLSPEDYRKAKGALEKQSPKHMLDIKDFGLCCPVCRTPYDGGLFCRKCGQFIIK